MSMSHARRSARGTHNALLRWRPPDDPAVVEAHRALQFIAAEEFIERLLAERPGLTLQHRAELAAALLAGRPA